MPSINSGSPEAVSIDPVITKDKNAVAVNEKSLGGFDVLDTQIAELVENNDVKSKHLSLSEPFRSLSSTEAQKKLKRKCKLSDKEFP